MTVGIGPDQPRRGRFFFNESGSCEPDQSRDRYLVEVDAHDLHHPERHEKRQYYRVGQWAIRHRWRRQQKYLNQPRDKQRFNKEKIMTTPFVTASAQAQRDEIRDVETTSAASSAAGQAAQCLLFSSHAAEFS